METEAPPLSSRAKVDRKQLILGWSIFWVLAVLAWAITVRLTTDMPMDMTMPIGMFIPMWISMMAAMMFPSVAPVALMWVRTIGSSSTGVIRVLRNGLFATGYLVTWGVFGLLAFLGSMGMTMLSTRYPGKANWLAAGLFVGAGIYQLTPLKDACLKHCRSPISQLLSYAALKGAWRDLRVGVHHGAYCVGCCWGIMLVLLAVGAMNLLVAGVLALVIFLEKIWSRGHLASKGFGVSMICLGVATIFFPMLTSHLLVSS